MVNHPLVFLPGLDGTGNLFAPLQTLLPPELPAVVARYPTDQLLNYQQLMPCIREVVPWDQPYTLVAESFAGPLAVEFAAAQREHVRALVLVSAFVTSPIPTLLQWARSYLSDFWLKRPIPEKLLRKFMLGEDCPPALVDCLAGAIKSVRPEVFAHRLRLAMDTDAKQALMKCHQPILYLLAAQDKLLGKRGWETIAVLKPNVTTVVMDGPHLLLQRKPRETIAAIEKFLHDLEARAEAA